MASGQASETESYFGGAHVHGVPSHSFGGHGFGHQSHHGGHGYGHNDSYGGLHHDDHHGYGNDDYGHNDHHDYGHIDHLSYGGIHHDDHHGYGHENHGYGHEDHGYGHNSYAGDDRHGGHYASHDKPKYDLPHTGLRSDFGLSSHNDKFGKHGVHSLINDHDHKKAEHRYTGYGSHDDKLSHSVDDWLKGGSSGYGKKSRHDSHRHTPHKRRSSSSHHSRSDYGKSIGYDDFDKKSLHSSKKSYGNSFLKHDHKGTDDCETKLEIKKEPLEEIEVQRRLEKIDKLDVSIKNKVEDDFKPKIEVKETACKEIKNNKGMYVEIYHL